MPRNADDSGSLATTSTHGLVHDTLPEGRWFRLLHLLPGKYDLKIYCELVTYEIAFAPPYEAISYCWGDLNDLVEVKCNGSSLNITASLAKALKRFRNEHDTRILWADGICINQLSDDERGHQVGMMDMVYGSGDRTIIWLGDAEGFDAAQSFATLRHFNEYMSGEAQRLLATNDPVLGSTQNWAALGKLLSLPWFRRVWVLQEVGVAKRATAFYGRHEIDLCEIALFAQFHHCVKKHMPAHADVATYHIHMAFSDIWARFGGQGTWISGVPVLKTIQDFWRAPQRSSYGIVEVLGIGRSFNASRDVDYIYGFLGHCEAKGPDGNTNLIEVDYKRSSEETYLLLATQVIRVSGSLRLLCGIQHSSEDRFMKNLPTWVPTYHTPPLYEFLTAHGAYNATLAKDLSFDTACSVNGRELTVTAIVADTIAEIFPPFSKDPDHLPQILEAGWKYYERSIMKDPDAFYSRLCWLFVHAYDLPPSLQADFLAFCRQNCNPGLFQRMETIDQFAEAQKPSAHTSAQRFRSRASEFCGGRKVFLTRGALCGMALQPACKDDRLAFIFGCPMPIVLRPSEDSLRYSLVCQAFVPGYMRGQIVDMCNDHSSGYRPQKIVLV